MQQTVDGRAAGEYIDWCNSHSRKKNGWYSSSMYIRALHASYEKKSDTKRHVVRDCEISDGAPIAGQHVNTAESRSRWVSSVRFAVR